MIPIWGFQIIYDINELPKEYQSHYVSEIDAT